MQNEGKAIQRHSRGSEGKSDKELFINGYVEDSNFDSNLDYIGGQNSSSNLRKGVKRVLHVDIYQEQGDP